MKMKNDNQYSGDDRWDWQLYLDSEIPDDLENFKEVKYILHPTFINPVRTIKDLTEGFKLVTNG